MISGDEILMDCNESELLWMARMQGHPLLRRGIPREELVRIIAGEIRPEAHHLSGTNHTRASLENGIRARFEIVRGQLPGCDGQCRTFKCTEEKHMSCFLPSARLLE